MVVHRYDGVVAGPRIPTQRRDLYKPGSRWGVLRGGSWANSNRTELLSSYRNVVDRTERDVIYGFRCVLSRTKD